MTPIPYNKKDMMHITLTNTDTLEEYEGEYIDIRLQMDTIPKEKYAYNCRHGDESDWFEPVTIEKGGVLVNFAGVFVTDKEIIFPEGQDYIPVKLEDIQEQKEEIERIRKELGELSFEFKPLEKEPLSGNKCGETTDTEGDEYIKRFEEKGEKIFDDLTDYILEIMFSKFVLSTMKKSTKEYITCDIIMPAIRNVSTDIFNYLLFGEKIDNWRKHISKPPRYSDRYRNKFYYKPFSNEFNDILFATETEAKIILDKIRYMIDTYGMASVSDLYDLAGVTCRSYTAHTRGWTDIKDVKIVETSEGYILKLPEPKLIYQFINKEHHRIDGIKFNNGDGHHE